MLNIHIQGNEYHIHTVFMYWGYSALNEGNNYTNLVS